MEWYRVHVPDASGHIQFRSGLSMQEIERCQEAFGTPFAPDVIELYRFGDGIAQGRLIYYTREILPLAEAITTGRAYWQHIQQIGEGDFNDAVHVWETCIQGVKRESWRPYWLPIVSSDGDYIMVDHEPDEGGTHGQVLDYCHEISGVTCVIAPSLREFFETILNELQDGKHTWNGGELEPVAWKAPNCKYFPTWPGGRGAPTPPD